jgi:hypothetical protein
MKKTKNFILKRAILATSCLILISCTLTPEKKTNFHHNSMVISHLDDKVDPTKNIVFASTFLMSWKVLKDYVIGEDIYLQDPVSLTPHLNIAAKTTEIYDDFVALGGLVKDDVISKINAELYRNFGFKDQEMNQYDDMDDNIICYSYFAEDVTFKYRFMEHKKPYPFFFNKNRMEVECFGLGKNDDGNNQDRIREQVELYDYVDCNDFIVKLNGTDDSNELYLAKIPFDQTMEQTIGSVEERIATSTPEQLKEGDLLVIPKINVNIDKTYDELLGKHLANKGFEKYFFAVADQHINFSLDESGAKTQSDAVVVLKKGPNDGKLLFDRPFLLYMKKKGADQPFFALWIANPDILIGSS